jgi:hypothetical protein
MRILLASAIIALAFISCTSDGTKAEGSINNTDSVQRADTAQVFVLPAPLQVATFLKTHAQDVHTEFLSDRDVPLSTYSTEYQRAMNLGVCIADAGYAALYNERQLALDYLSRAEQLVKLLRLEPAAAPFLLRLRNNIENHDSLSFLVLTMYSEMQDHLNEGNREKTAFFIVSGCYLENLAITLQHEKLATHPEFIQLVAQEKLWLDNLTEALTYLAPDAETQDLYNTFFTLQQCCADVTITIGKDNRPTAVFDGETFGKFMQKSIQLRNEATGRKEV